MADGIEYLAKNGGACTTQDYPYTARDGSCKKTCTPVVKPTGYKHLATTDAAHIEALQSGPISVAVAASSSAFQFYSSGVLTRCTDQNLNHGVTLVGFVTVEGTQAYILRNSWGTSWGSKGYMYIKAGEKLCGLTTTDDDGYPTLA